MASSSSSSGGSVLGHSGPPQGHDEYQALLDEGIRIKEQGNECFRNQKYMEAIKKYKRSILVTQSLRARGRSFSVYLNQQGVEPIHEDLEHQLHQLTVTLYCNLCACYIKINDGEKAIRYSDKVLEIEPDNTKAMLRKGQAAHIIGDLLSADAILTRAAKVHTKADAISRTVREELKEVRAKLKTKTKGFGKKFAEAFGHTRNPRMQTKVSTIAPVVDTGGDEESESDE